MTPCCCLFPRFFGVKSGVNGFVAVPTCPASGKTFICLGLAPDATLDGVGGPNKDCCSDLSKPRLDKSSTLPSLCPVCSAAKSFAKGFVLGRLTVGKVNGADVSTVVDDVSCSVTAEKALSSSHDGTHSGKPSMLTLELLSATGLPLTFAMSCLTELELPASEFLPNVDIVLSEEISPE